MKRVLPIVIIVAACLWGCKPQVKEEPEITIAESKVHISGTIDSVTFRTISITYFDLVRDEARYSVVVDDKTGEFGFDITIYHPHDILVTYGTKSFQLFVEPHDSIFIKFSGADFARNADGNLSSLAFTGDNSDVNTSLLEYNRFRSIPSFSVAPDGLTVKQYLGALVEQMNKELAELDSFAQIHKPSDKFLRWARSSIRYGNANYLIDYQMCIKGSYPLKNDSLFTSPFFPVRNNQGFLSSMFLPHVFSYAGQLYLRSDTSIMGLIGEAKMAQAYERTIQNILRLEPSGLERDVMLFHFCLRLLGQSLEIAEDSWTDVKPTITSPALIDIFERLLLDRKNNSTEGIFYLPSFSSDMQVFEGDPVDYLIELSKKQVVLVDIWATWCSPCVGEIPNLLEISNDLIAKNVMFVGLCSRSDRQTWHQIVRDNQLPGIHFLFNREQTKALADRLEFDGYPTYMIFAGGQLAASRAPWPSDSAALLFRITKIKRLYKI
ncbi:MAG: TlpA disulfide reductase family protein [Tenuifilaceae bacterium]|jgi:thiol-disulfide isomerase/thioredoxin|nr:TlpA disulfide reductase family protein [Tenuifilaceae bacterium]